MGIAVDAKKAQFFERSLNLLLDSVIPATHFASFTRRFNDTPDFVLRGFGHEANALLILDCLSGLPEGLSGGVLENLVIRAAVRCKSDGKGDRGGFIESMTFLCREQLDRPATRYHCLLLLQTKSLPEWVTTVQILGHRLQPATKASMQAMKRELPEVLDRTGLIDFDLTQTTPVEIAIHGRRPEEAFGVAEEVSRALRGAYLAGQNSTWHFAGRPKGLNEFKPSPLYFLRSGRKHVSWAYTPNCEIASISLPAECPSRTAFLLKVLSRKPAKNTPLELLASALSLYASSGDALQAQDRFLAMWQTIEILSLVDSGRTADIASAIGRLWNDGLSVITPRLIALSSFRNKYVHAGEYETERQSVTFLLNHVTQDTLVRFAWLCEKLPTKQHFKEFQSMMTLGPTDLRTKTEAMKIVKEIRRL